MVFFAFCPIHFTLLTLFLIQWCVFHVFVIIWQESVVVYYSRQEKIITTKTISFFVPLFCYISRLSCFQCIRFFFFFFCEWCRRSFKAIVLLTMSMVVLIVVAITLFMIHNRRILSFSQAALITYAFLFLLWVHSSFVSFQSIDTCYYICNRRYWYCRFIAYFFGINIVVLSLISLSFVVPLHFFDSLLPLSPYKISVNDIFWASIDGFKELISVLLSICVVFEFTCSMGLTINVSSGLDLSFPL